MVEGETKRRYGNMTPVSDRCLGMKFLTPSPRLSKGEPVGVCRLVGAQGCGVDDFN